MITAVPKPLSVERQPRFHVPASVASNEQESFTRSALNVCAHRRPVQLEFVRPDKSTENAFIESSNSRPRDEGLQLHWFLSIEDARRTIQRAIAYDTNRPRSGLGGQTLAEIAKMNQKSSLTELAA